MTSLRRRTLLCTMLLLAPLAACAPTRTHEGTGEFVDDTVITTKVKAAFINDPLVKVNEITVETFKGRVQLSGFVRNQREVDRAVEIAWQVPGVKAVKNDTVLKTQ